MTIDPDEDQLRVETTPVGRTTKSRPIALGTVAFGVLGVVMIATLIGGGRDSGNSPTEPPGAAVGSVSPSTVTYPAGPTRTAAVSSVPTAAQEPGRSSSPASSRADATPRPSLDALPAPANVALAGSPEIVLFQRIGDDLKVLGWRPGEPGLATRQTLLGAARGFDDLGSGVTELSPEGSLLLVQVYGSTIGGPQDSIRLFRLEGTGGREIWHSTTLGSALAARFAPSGQLIITSGAPQRRDRGWTIVDVSGDKAVVHDIDLPPISTPAPSASVDLRVQTFYYVPLALSADGRWLYALSTHATEPYYRPAYRISIATGRAERIDAFPITGAARIVSPMVDRVSGRFLLSQPGSTSTGPGFVEAWSAGARTADFHVNLGVVFGAVWADDGGVITADYDRVPGPFHFRVLSISATGTVGTTYLTAEGDNAALVGVRNGFAVAYVASSATAERELVVIRLANGATSSVRVSDPDGLLFNVGLRP